MSPLRIWNPKLNSHLSHEKSHKSIWGLLALRILSGIFNALEAGDAALTPKTRKSYEDRNWLRIA